MSVRSHRVKNVRICLECGHRTKSFQWKDNLCPVCGINAGYELSYHNALSDSEILALKSKILTMREGAPLKEIGR